jgi:hypothetical protein
MLMPQLSGLGCCETGMTNFGSVYKNDVYIADKVTSKTLVSKIADNYRITIDDEAGKSNNKYYCEQLARMIAISDMDIRQAPPSYVESNSILACTERLHLDIELWLASILMNRFNYPESNRIQLNETTSWVNNSFDNSKGEYESFGLDDITKAKKMVFNSCGHKPTHIVMNYAAQKALADNHQNKDIICYYSKDMFLKSGCFVVILGLEVIDASALMCVSDVTGTPVKTEYVWQDDQKQACALVVYMPKETHQNTKYWAPFCYDFDAPDSTTASHGYLTKTLKEKWLDVLRIEVRTTRDFAFGITDGTNQGHKNNGLCTAGAIISGVCL